MTNLQRLMHRGYYDATDGDGSDLPGGGSDETEGGKGTAEAGSEKDEGQAGDDKDDGSKEHMIPKSRFDQAVSKARKAEEAAAKRAAELEAQLKAQQGTADLSKLSKELEDLEDALDAAVADNNVEAKKRIRAEIREKNQQLADSRAEARAQRATAVAIEQIRYDAVVARIEEQYPALDPDSDQYDEDTVAEVGEIYEAFVAKGLPSSEALKKAVGVHFRGATPPAKKDAGSDKGETDPDAAAKAEAAALARREAAVKRGLDTKGKQPTDPKKSGLDSNAAGKSRTAKDIAKMSDEEYDKLPEDEKKRLRGDAV